MSNCFILGIVFIILDVIQIPYGNAGGHIAHLGGALLGFIYANKLKNGDTLDYLLKQLY